MSDKLVFTLPDDSTLSVFPFLTDSCEVLVRSEQGYILAVATLHLNQNNSIYDDQDGTLVINNAVVDVDGMPVEETDAIITAIGKTLKRNLK